MSLLQGESNGSPVVAHLLPHALVKLLSSVTAVQDAGTDTCSSICGYLDIHSIVATQAQSFLCKDIAGSCKHDMPLGNFTPLRIDKMHHYAVQGAEIHVCHEGRTAKVCVVVVVLAPA